MVTLEPRVRTVHLECRKNLGSPPSSGEAEKGDDCSDGRFVRTAPLPPHKKWPQAHAWGHFLSCGEEGSNSTAARRRQAISPVGCCFVSGCGTQRLLRPLSGPCILLATAPTASPCFRRWRWSSLLQVPPCRNVYGGRCRCAAPSPCLGSFFILRRRGAEQHSRPQAASDQPGNLEESLPARLDEHPQNPYTIRSRRSKK